MLIVDPLNEWIIEIPHNFPAIVYVISISKDNVFTNEFLYIFQEEKK